MVYFEQFYQQNNKRYTTKNKGKIQDTSKTKFKSVHRLNIVSFLPPLVLAAQKQRKVEQDSEEEPPSDRDPQAIPLAEIRNPLLLQNVVSCGQASGARDPHTKRLAHS